MSPVSMVYQDPTQPVEQRVQDLLSRMTLAEKIGQMTQAEKNSIPPADVSTYFLGSVLSGGGGNPTPNNVHTWRAMVQAYMQASLATRLRIPIIYGSDGVHGHNNVEGATIFPHNIGLGASRDAGLVERIAQATASELLATNVHWDFAPALSVPQDIRWGRTYEGYSEDPQLVSELGTAYVRGLQRPAAYGDRVTAAVKHFVGDGGTEWGSRGSNIPAAALNWQAASTNWHIDQGDTRLDEATLRAVHLAPYHPAIAAGAHNVMVSFSSWNGLKMHAHPYLLTTVLKGEWGFQGFLVSDWMAVSQLHADYEQAVSAAINAGLDMVMVPYDYKTFIQTMQTAVAKGAISLERIDDAVARILRVKFLLGLFERPVTDERYLESFGAAAHRALAQEAVQKSLVLLKNEQVFPLSPRVSLNVAGRAADDIGLACGGWTIAWQGAEGAITTGSTLLSGLQSHTTGPVAYAADGVFAHRATVGLVVLAEKPYAEGEGDSPDLSLTAEEVALIERVRGQCEQLVLVLYSGRPRIITAIVPLCAAVVAAWLPGSEAAALAPVLFGKQPFSGKLSFTWYKTMAQLPLSNLRRSDEQPLWPFGYGLTR